MQTIRIFSSAIVLLASGAACGGGEKHDARDRDEDPELPDAGGPTEDGGGPSTACGDGVVDAGEECDLGSSNSDTGVCRTDCTEQVCGDGFVGPGEGCNDCVPPNCGDGIVDPGEQCDDANYDEQDACLNSCSAASCGDDHVWNGVEECDDGNASNADGCLATCVRATCGDGHVRDGVEACDDGNAADTDACLPTCVDASCGDGITWAGEEECDDANADDTDGCVAGCNAARCGDGFERSGVEECDDGDAVDGDGCTNDCARGLWTRIHAGDADEGDYGTGIAADADGNVVVTGYVVNDLFDEQGIWVRKYDPDGEAVWTDLYDLGFLGREMSRDVETDAAGNVLVAGDVDSEIWVRKYEPDGDVLWTVTEDDLGAYRSRAYGVAADAAGNVFVAGWIEMSAGDDEDTWLRKYAPDGSVIWTRTFDAGCASFGDHAYGVATDGDGNVVIAGDYTAPGGVGCATGVLVRKYDADGAVLWTLQDDASEARGVATDADGNVVVVGFDWNGGAGEGDDLWIRKYDRDGTRIWTRTHSGAASDDDYGYGIATDGDGNVLVTGRVVDRADDANIWVRKYDADGDEVWTDSPDVRTSVYEGGAAIAADSSGNVLVTGYVYVDGSEDIWVRKYGP
jgi:uncharacterized delta-60 repeat protein